MRTRLARLLVLATSFGTLGLGAVPSLLAACASDDAPAAAPSAPSATVSATSTATSPPPPPPPPPATKGCSATATSDAFAFDPGGPPTQIHAYAVPTEDGLWVVYNRPKAMGGRFDVYATRLRCDGTVSVSPVRVTTSDDNEIDPSAAWDGQKLVVVWSADMADRDPNLELRTRVLAASGEPLGPVEPLAINRRGAPVGGNVWMPALSRSPLPNGGYTLVGTWGHADAPAFQTFAQALDADAHLVGDGEDIGLDPAASHDAPAVAHTNEGIRIIAYSSIANDAPNDRIADVRTQLGTDATTVQAEQGGHATVSASASGTWIAWQDNVRRLGSPIASRKGLFQPAIAAADEGAAVVAYTGAANKTSLRAYRLTAEGAFGAAPPFAVATGAAAYALHLEHVGGDVFLVAYQEGAGQEITGYARFLTLPR